MDAELSERMSALVAQLKSEALAQGKNATAKGELTLKLKFTAEAAGGGRDVMIETSYESTRKEPKPSRSREMFFAGPAGTLTREQPRQTTIPFESEIKKGLN